MIEKIVSYNTQTYNALKAFIYILPAYVLMVVAIIFGLMPLHQPLISTFILILMLLMPFLFQKKVKMLFTRNVLLEFNDQSFTVQEYKKESDTLAKSYSFNWSDIKSYKCSFSRTNITFLTIYLKNGTNKIFPFKDEKDQDKAMNEKSAFSIFYYFVYQYNSEKQPENQIGFNQGFLTTTAGAYTLVALGILALVDIVLNIILKPTAAIFFVVMGVFIVLGLIIKRAGDKTFYNKIISKLAPHSPYN